MFPYLNTQLDSTKNHTVLCDFFWEDMSKHLLTLDMSPITDQRWNSTQIWLSEGMSLLRLPRGIQVTQRQPHLGKAQAIMNNQSWKLAPWSIPIFYSVPVDLPNFEHVSFTSWILWTFPLPSRRGANLEKSYVTKWKHISVSMRMLQQKHNCRKIHHECERLHSMGWGS